MSSLPTGSSSGAWVAYRKWARTSAYHKAVIDRLTTQSLWLAIVGAVLATLGQQLMPAAPKEGMLIWLYKAPGILGSAAVALAAYLAKQAMTGDKVRTWTRARAAAESLKSGIFLFRASIPPFSDADRVTQLVARVKKLEDDLKDVEPRPPDDKPEVLSQLTVDQYISERVDEQVKWYTRRAAEHQHKADFCRKATTVLGAAGVLLALGATSAAVSAWAAVVATITASISAHLKNQQYQTLAATYQSTALRLMLLKDEWTGKQKTDQEFIQQCEDTMATENGAWMELWSKKNAAAAAASDVK